MVQGVAVGDGELWREGSMRETEKPLETFEVAVPISEVVGNVKYADVLPSKSSHPVGDWDCVYPTM
jgi:hypothetical protein